MPSYRYKAVNKDGLIVRNNVEASSRVALIRKLKENGLSPITINNIIASRNSILGNSKKEKRNIGNLDEILKKVKTTQLEKSQRTQTGSVNSVKNYFSIQKKITQRDLVIFTQNLYLLKKANFNNIYALETIISSTENMAFAEIIEDILAGVEAGDYMYKTMEYYPQYFPYIYVNMIRVGELSGSLENSLLQAVEYLDSNKILTKKLHRILIPNIAQFILIIVMLLVGVIYALPQIEGVLEEVGADVNTAIPKTTLMFQAFMKQVMIYWPIPVTILSIIIVILAIYIQTPKGRYKFHYFKYTMPLFGKLLFSIDFSRLIKAMLLNLRNGVRIQDALNVSKNVVNNYVMLALTENAINNILIGESWIEPFEASGLASPMITEMLKIGMQTDLAEMMDKLVDYMEFDINNTIDNITMVLPQVLYGIVGTFLILFVLIFLVPMVQLYFGNFLFDAYL